MKQLNCLILLKILVGCALFEHRDYFDQMSDFNFSDESLFRANDDFMVISGDTGRYHRNEAEILKRTPASGEDAYDSKFQMSLQRELTFLESKLTDDEYYEFDRVRDDIGSLSEQIYFLRLSQSQKNDYLVLKGIKERKRNITRNKNSSRSILQGNETVAASNDVTLGMTMEKVLSNWGTPERRDIAGNPKYRNERWAFRKNGKVRYVYFEDGQVNGWSDSE